MIKTKWTSGSTPSTTSHPTRNAAAMDTHRLEGGSRDSKPDAQGAITVPGSIATSGTNMGWTVSPGL